MSVQDTGKVWLYGKFDFLDEIRILSLRLQANANHKSRPSKDHFLLLPRKVLRGMDFLVRPITVIFCMKVSRASIFERMGGRAKIELRAFA